MADKRISQLIERTDIANNDVLPIVASGATTTNKVTVSTLQDWMQDNLDVGVTSVGITIGSTGTDINVSGSPITTSGNITINIPTASATNRGLLSSANWTTFNNKLSSVGLTMPSAFTVSNSPLTANGTIAVTGAGTVAQYIRGDGSLADFPEAGGGGASVSYYLNGSVSQGTIGGVAYYEMNKTPILGTGTDFVAIADGYLASFITDAGDPSLLEIPGGNWNFETYFSASSGGGTPSFYIELYKVNSGGTATLIASNSATPELIAFGTTITPYFSTLAVPTTTLALTDRLALRYYVARSGRTITLHTENGHLCQIITTFTTGLTALNGLTAQVQNFATGTSGTDFAISSAGSTHTFNLPDASATARGVVSTNSQVFTGVKTFSNGLSLPAVGGSNQTTRLVNIGTIHEGSAGSNQIGFNNSNNIYFGKGLNNGGVISWNNAAVRYYTLPDADGTIALTSQIPANPVGGSGTINQIPKYTSSTTTIGNSNISDNGSDVVIASRTGISLSGQSILLTPNLGGTTNRIETTGGLPLALVTSGSSITLAAGGTTPQITLASTGAVTLTGALNGTSASFNTTNAITLTASDSRIRGGDTAGRLLLANSGTTTYGIFYGSSHATLPNAIQFVNDNTPSLTLSSTGAATFTGDVSLSGASGNRSLNITSNTSGNPTINLIAAGVDSATISYNRSTSELNFANSGASSALKIASTGAATFSSSVTAGGNIQSNITKSGSGVENVNFLQLRLLGTNAIGDSLDIRYLNSAGNNIANISAILGGDNVAYGSLAFSTRNFNTDTMVEAMRINNRGNVGIGTASPVKKLQINVSPLSGEDDGINVNNGTTNFLFTRTGSSYTYRGVAPLSGMIYSENNISLLSDGGNITFHNSGGERMRITSLGELLWNVQGLNGSDLTTGGVLFRNNSGKYVQISTGLTTDSPLMLFYKSNGAGGVTNTGSISTSGNLTLYNTTSDYRLKEDLQDFNALEKIANLKIYDFAWKHDQSRSYGVLAHELAEVLPYSVFGEKDAIEEDEEPKLQQVDYSKIVPILIKAIQEQQEQINQLKNQIK